MSRRFVDARSRFFGVVTLIGLVLAVFAQPAPAVDPVRFSSFDATLLTQTQGGMPVLLVNVTLPETVPLPSEVAVPLPAGSEILWAGEVFGGALEDDIQFENPVLEERNGATVAVLTLTESRVAQVEVTFPEMIQRRAEGGSVAGFAIVTPTGSEAARLAIALPPGGEPVSIPEGVMAATGRDNLIFYYRDSFDIPAGSTLELSMPYTLAPVAIPVPAAGGGGDEVPPYLLIGLAVVLSGAVLAALGLRARGRAARSAEEGDEAAQFALSEGEQAEPGAVDSIEDDGVSMEDHERTAPIPAETPAVAGIARFLTPQVLLIVAAAMVLLIVVVLNAQGGEQRVGVTEISDGQIAQRISTADDAQQVAYTIQISCGCSPQEEALRVFDALRLVPGVATASLDEETLLLQVAFDPSISDEAEITEILQSRGYLP